MLREMHLMAKALAIAGILSVTACSAAGTPTPTSAPAKPTAAPPGPAATAALATKSVATATVTAVPKPAATASAKPAASADWKADWDKSVAAAKQEGKVVLAGARGDLFRSAVMEFQKTYPDVRIDYTPVSGADFAPKAITERGAGQYLWDAAIVGADTMLTLKKQKVIDPLKPILVQPEVLNDSSWLGGFEEGWTDIEQQFIYTYVGFVMYGAFINRAVVPESELKSIDQLLDPRLKGKIAMRDPRKAGSSATFNGYAISVKGEDWLRKLLNQDIVIVDDPRLLLEGLIRGRYGIAMGTSHSDFPEFTRQGLTGDIKPLDEDNAAARYITGGGSGSMAVINKAPHPNAVKVFLNWLLSKDGQTAYSKIGGVVSRRLDVVGGPTEDAPDPKQQYYYPQKEKNGDFANQAIAIAKEIIK